MSVPASRDPQRPIALPVPALLLFGAAAGAVWGVFCGWADLRGSEIVGLAANTAGPWLLLAFLVGTRARRAGPAAMAGGLALVVGVVAYYVAHELGDQAANREGILATKAWAPVAIAAGGVFGAAGRASLSSRRPLRLIATAMIGGALLAEGLLILDDTVEGTAHQTFGTAEMLLGLAMPLLLLQTRDRMPAFGLLAIVALIGFVFEEPLLEAVRESLRR